MVSHPAPAHLGLAAESAQKWIVLGVSTLAFAVNFWAWALLSPLAPGIGQRLGLAPFTQSILVALPVIIGSVGRIPVGSLTDRYGARPMFTALSLLTIVPVLLVGLFPDALPVLMIGGVLLGLGGTTFAVGVPAVNGWFPPANRGTALGVFGVGTGGTAVATFSTLPLASAYGQFAPFLVVSVALAVVAALSWALLRDPADRTAPAGSAFSRTVETLQLGVTWQLSVLYALTFGGFVAFSVYLPTYLKTAYDLTAADASTRTAGFVVLAVIARPIGGWLCDRVHPATVLGVLCSLAALLAVLAACEFPLVPVGTIAFLGLAAVLGAGAGAVFALVAKLAPADQVGAVTGLVGAAGGLGGFFPPLVMGAIYGTAGQYTWGFALLALAAVGCAALALTVVRRAAAA
ncbi:MFS transporter, NNP family, nitrate/nitrite transporter [Saccharopolyspora antimicrobica]|uniref:MFS transporter, NNP family, nitrate/nitrite transporter n=1 Tax=Saccharopolyspora antimicrobica TaxID=455193 RepID=A0A1I5A2S3_9PSEU|nr:MFS transporter [Saccharopolyspora antimicrobica]RKT83296.1 NNP family nitrate/nitrite transporter-like MFS transporter [Saccharopolyspora antimicrobica]SFN56801.1 MFS transporter, NNP family, nitrate/nitrite transporter [Saccharopolyspora antimicrobica]